MRNQKSVIFVMTLMVLLIGLTAISAADTGNNTASSVISDNTISADTTSVGSIASTVSDTKTVKSEAKTITKTNSEKLVSDTTKKTIKSNMKNTKKTNSEITVNNDNFDTYFTSNGFTDEVQTGSKINFGTNITRNNHSYVLNKQVTIDGKGNTLSLNTISGSYYGNETGSAFIIDHGASGTQLSNLNFYNTQVFVRNTTNVTVSNVNVTVENQRIGQGVGVFSIRDNASYVTVENSNFKTTNNSGSSTLVLAGASYCNINNNTITGTGDVGNLLYLTTYNVAGVAEDDIELNSYNNITNNVLNGPSTTSLICYGITLTGHDNLIANNIVNVAGQGITTQWGYTDPAAPQNGNNSDRYKGNYYINNTVNRGASFKATNNSTVEYNNITGVVSLGVNTTATNNIFGATTLVNNNIIENNTVNGLVTVSGSNITINHNTIKANINIKKTTYTNVSITNNVIYGVIINNETVYEYNNTLIPPTNNNKKSLKSMNKIIISASNYLDYFEYDPDDGLYWNYGLPENTWIVINAIPMNVQIAQIILMQNSILEFKNMNTSILYVWMGTNSTIRNSQMNYSNYATAIALGAKCVLDNLTFIANYPELPSKHIDLITQTGTDGIIRNCNIKVNLTTNTIDWSAGESESKIVPIKVKYNNVVLENNNITINVIGTDNSGYPTGYGLSIFANNTTVKNNNINYICKEGLSGWVYPIYVVTSNNTITDNNIVVKGTNYTAGIYFDSTSFSNNTVSNNIINLTCGTSGYGEGTTNENVGYGVCFTNRAYTGGSYTTTKGSVFNNKVINNTIYTNGYSSYAVEQFGGDNTLIANNTLILNGTTPMGIGVIGLNTTITGNHITVTGKDNATYPSVDYIRPRTTGVYLSRGINNTVTNNTINSQNNAGIIIDGETNDIVRYNTVKSLNNTYAVTVTGDNHQVTDNSLVAKELSGDNSVLATGENNTIKDNTGNTGKSGVLTITLNPTEAHINDTVVVNVKFVDEDGNAISSKPIHIKVDEFGIDTTVNTNENGIATTDFVVTKLSDTVFVEASYDGTDYAVEGQTAILDITKYETELTVNDQLNVFTPNSNCTINGTLTDKTNPIANAEIIISIANMDGVIVTTDNDGKYSYTFNVGATEGTYNVEVTYNGNDKYEDAVATTSYDVEKYGTILKIDPIDNTTPKSNMIITGSLVEFYTSEGVANAEITITLNNNTYTNMTDANGIFKFNIVAPANTGKYTVDASYAGNDTHDMDTDSAEFNVEKIDSIITIDAIGSVDANSNVNVTGILVDSAQNAISNQEVTITVNNKKYTTTTGSDGKYVVTIMSPVVSGNYDVSASYAGSDVYTMASAQTSMFVKEETSITAEGPISATVNSTITINGTLIDTKNNGIANATITVVFEGKDYTTTTNNDGKFTCDIMTTTVGDNIPVTVRYDGNDTYMASSEIISVDVEKLGSELTLNPVNNTSINSTVDVSGVLSEEYTQKAIANSTVTIIVDGISYNTVTDDNGNFKVTIKTAATTGTYTIKASYDGSDLYTPSSDETTFDVEKISSSITIDAIGSVDANSNVNVTGILVDSAQNAISNQEVTITVNNKKYTTTTGSDGKYVVTIMSPVVSGNYDVSASYAGSDVYTMASAQTSMFVKEETSITAEGPISATVNSTITINGTLIDTKNNGIANATITVVFEGKDYTTTTNNDGKFTCDIMTTTVGDNIPVTVRYDGNDTYMASSEIISVDVEKLGSELTLNPVNNTSINSTVDVSGVLSEEYTQKAIANSTVTIIVDGISYNTVTDDNGNFKVTIKTAATTGTYTIKASYDGSDLYTPSSDETTFDVEKISTKTTVDAVNGVIYEKVNLTAHITDVNGNNVTGGKVVFSINGVEVTDNNGNVIYANVTGGVATITKEAPRVWHKENTTIVATYLGNDAYDDSVSEKADVIITLRTANIDVLTNGTKVKVGDTTSIIAHVYYNNTLVNEGKVIFKLNGKTLKDDDGNIIFVKVENGIAKLDYTITSIYSAKEYTLTAVFSGKDYNRVATESHLTVLRTNTHIQAEMVNITSNNATVSLKIFDEKNNLINRDTKVTVKVNGKTVYNQIIVSNGVANLNLNLPVSSKPYNITIISGENSVYATSTTSFMFKNTVKIPTKVTATAKLVNNKTATVSVKINDNNNKPVTGNTKVVVKLNGKTQANAIAVNGVADIDMIPPTIKGTYTLVVMTGETSIYEKATTTTTLKV